MLVLSRKPLQTIRVGRDITITVRGIHAGAVKIGIDAPRSVTVLRGELVGRAKDDGGYDNDAA